MSYTFTSFDISDLLTSTPKKLGLDHHVSTEGVPAVVQTADGGRRYPMMNRTPAVNPPGSPKNIPRQVFPEEMPDNQQEILDNLGAVGGRGPDLVPEGAFNNVGTAARMGGCHVQDDDILQIVGEDRGVPGLLVSNSRVTPANQHLFEFLIGFTRDLGDRSASLIRNGINNGKFFIT